MDVFIVVTTIILIAISVIGVLPQLGVDIRIWGRSGMAAELSAPKRKPWLALAMVTISTCFSIGAFVYFFHPRIRERIVEKPVEKVVEKQISVPCPQSKPSKPEKSQQTAKIDPPKAPEQHGDNAGAIGGSLSQGAGSIAQIGGNGNQATVNNFTPPERHLVPAEIAELRMVADAMPTDAGSWFHVDTLNLPESTSFATEIYNIFSSKNKAVPGPDIWMVSPTPTPKGVYVLVLQGDAHFSVAQNLVNVLAKYLPKGSLTFMSVPGLKPGEVKILIGAQ